MTDGRPAGAASSALPESSLGQRVVWLTAVRLVILTALLAFATVFTDRAGLVGSTFTTQTVLVTLAIAYAFAAIQGAVLRVGRGVVAVAHAQLVIDQAVWSVLVYLTGGPTSGASAFYGLTVVGGAVLTGLRGATVAALAAAFGYGTIALGAIQGWLPPPPDQLTISALMSYREVQFHVMANASALLLVVLLSGYLAERLRLTGGELARERERAEQAERMALLGRLATGLAHEIRNPLSAVSGSIQLLRTSRALTEEDRQLCRIIQREASRLNDLVTDMMQLARPRPRDPVPVNLTQLAREVVTLASSSGRGGSDVPLRAEGADDVTVLADHDQLRQLLWNLVRNAVQASEPGAEVVVWCAGRGQGAVLEVRDRGRGIAPETLPHLFDAFFTTRSQGTGIGLAVVKRIADDHGFEVEVESEPGSGATFRVLFPPAAIARPAADEVGR